MNLRKKSREDSKIWQLKSKLEFKEGGSRISGHGKRNVCFWVKGKMKNSSKVMSGMRSFGLPWTGGVSII